MNNNNIVDVKGSEGVMYSHSTGKGTANTTRSTTIQPKRNKSQQHHWFMTPKGTPHHKAETESEGLFYGGLKSRRRKRSSASSKVKKSQKDKTRKSRIRKDKSRIRKYKKKL
jgi:hypothetical protein